MTRNESAFCTAIWTSRCGSAEAAGDVGLGGLLVGVAEDLARSGSSRPARPGLPAPARLKNAVSSETRAACCMLWVTITIV